MFAVYGIYDGKSVKIREKLPINKKYKVVITFIEELTRDDQELRDFASLTNGLEFWENTAEDIYQEYLKKPDK